MGFFRKKKEPPPKPQKTAAPQAKAPVQVRERVLTAQGWLRRALAKTKKSRV